MPGTNNNVERKLEAAMVSAVMRKINDALQGHSGLTDDSLSMPHFSAHVPSSTEAIQGTGTMVCELEVKVKSDSDTKSADGSSVDHANREGLVFDAILTSPMLDFIGDLNSTEVEDFTAFVLRETGRMTGTEGRCYVSTLKLAVICCGARLG